MFPIETERLRLRPLRPDDLEALAEVYLDPRVTRWIGPHTWEDVEQEIVLQAEHQAAHGWSFWAVEERATGRMIGDCGLQPLEHRGPEVELGYDLHPDTWGRGLATEAAGAALAAGLVHLEAPRLIAVVDAENQRSLRVPERLGMRRVGDIEAHGRAHILFAIQCGR